MRNWRFDDWNGKHPEYAFCTLLPISSLPCCADRFAGSPYRKNTHWKHRTTPAHDLRECLECGAVFSGVDLQS